MRLPFDASGSPTGEEPPVLRHGGTGAAWPSGLRPVDVRFDLQGRLAFTCDKTGLLVRLSHSSAGGGASAATSASAASSAEIVGIVAGATGAALLSACVVLAARAWRRRKRATGGGPSSGSLEVLPRAVA